MEISEIIRKISERETFRAITKDGSFSIAIDDYVPFVCTAIHNGSNLRKDLRNKAALTRGERWVEEDPLTGQFISALPIRIIAHDSRYEYDLNRRPEECIYQEAWGAKIWKDPLSEEQRRLSLEKHENFYRVVAKLVSVLRKQFRKCVVYDMHSYNYQVRPHSVDPPTFNVGTEQLEDRGFRKEIDRWLQELRKIKLPHHNTTAIENAVFWGRGYLAERLLSESRDVLVLPTEILKVYCDETSGDDYPEIVDGLREQLKSAIISHASFFISHNNIFKVRKKNQLLSAKIDDDLRKVDDGLSAICKELELLEYINPINIETERKKFYLSRFKHNPTFRYKPLKISPRVLKRALYALPVAGIPDVGLQQLYQDAIDSQAFQLDMLATRDTSKFFYHSLIYFGEPSEADISNSRWLHRSPEQVHTDETIDHDEAAEIMKGYIRHYGFKGHVEIVRNLSSKAMFVISKRVVRLRRGETFTRKEVEALGHHEVGIHMLTTENALCQPLKLLQIGLPTYTYSQEGLAILSEYLSGNMLIDRLRHLAHRALGVRHMTRHHDFKETFAYLVDGLGLSENRAFYICARVYRGGGFTKDYLYLKGFRDILQCYTQGRSLDPLLVGKVSIGYMDLIKELIDRGMLNPPKYQPACLTNPDQNSNQILGYVIEGLKASA